MTDLQRAFAEQYVIDYKITAAGKRAGIQGDNINVTAWQMLQHPDVQEYVQLLQDQASLRCQVSKDELLLEFKKIGFSDITNYMDDNLSPKKLSKSKDTGVIKSIKKTVTEWEFGTKTQVEFTLHDKVASLVNIGRHIGFFQEDNAQKNLTVQLMTLDPLNATTVENNLES